MKHLITYTLLIGSVCSMASFAQEAGTSTYSSPTMQNTAPTTPTSSTLQTTQPIGNGLQSSTPSSSYPPTQNSYQNSGYGNSPYQNQLPAQQYQERTRPRASSQYNPGERLNNPNASY